jgi:hypothetical protein
MQESKIKILSCTTKEQQKSELHLNACKKKEVIAILGNIRLIISLKSQSKYSFKVFVFKIINCTFASPLMGMECLIKYILWTH